MGNKIMLKIADLRKEKGISQKDFSKKLGVSAGNLCEWEKGRIEPSIEMLIKISKELGVSVDYLIGNEDDFGNIMVSQLTDRNNLSEKEKECLRLFSTLGLFEQDSILIQLRALAEVSKDKKGIK